MIQRNCLVIGAHKQPILEHKTSLGLDDCRQKVEGRGAQIKVVSYRIMWGLAMNVVSVLRTRTVDSKACGQESQKQDDGERECRQISLLSVLEAENIRLRQAVIELLIDTLALQEALQRREASTQARRSASVVRLGRAHDVSVAAVGRGCAGTDVADV
jgi:hypothetical protein